MAAENLTVFGAIDDERHGVTLPRIFTPPLRPLTKETSNGFAVIAFAEIMLHVHLYPWQQWLLVHALELLEDGSYRFRKVIVLVARQNGKTTLMGVFGRMVAFRGLQQASRPSAAREIPRGRCRADVGQCEGPLQSGQGVVQSSAFD